jgi:hypothetical protein
MSIRHVVTRGFGNGTFDGTIAAVVKRGYVGAPSAPSKRTLNVGNRNRTRGVGANARTLDIGNRNRTNSA